MKSTICFSKVLFCYKCYKQYVSYWGGEGEAVNEKTQTQENKYQIPYHPSKLLGVQNA